MERQPLKLLSAREFDRARIEMLRDLTGHRVEEHAESPAASNAATQRTDIWSTLLLATAARR